MLRAIILVAAITMAPGLTTPAGADTYPSRTITAIVPFPAGGPLDSLARILVERMRAALGQPIIIENVAGASGNIGTGRVARAAGDGYTLGFGSLSTHVSNPAVFSLKYDVRTDFEPIALIVSQPLVILGRKDLPPKDLRDLIAWLKANPDKATQGTSGSAAIPQLTGLLFQQQTGTKFRFVPYRGGSLAMQDLVAGRIDMVIDLPPNALPQVEGATVKSYAVTAKRRMANAPNVPTVDEAGLPGLHVALWQGLFAPKGTPKDVIAKLNAAVVESLADPDVRQRIEALGQDIIPRDQQTPEALAAMQEADIAKWWPIIKAANLKAE